MGLRNLLRQTDRRWCPHCARRRRTQHVVVCLLRPGTHDDPTHIHGPNGEAIRIVRGGTETVCATCNLPLTKERQ